jgi:hypothetical protein
MNSVAALRTGATALVGTGMAILVAPRLRCWYSSVAQERTFQFLRKQVKEPDAITLEAAPRIIPFRFRAHGFPSCRRGALDRRRTPVALRACRPVLVALEADKIRWAALVMLRFVEILLQELAAAGQAPSFPSNLTQDLFAPPLEPSGGRGRVLPLGAAFPRTVIRWHAKAQIISPSLLPRYLLTC